MIVTSGDVGKEATGEIVSIGKGSPCLSKSGLGLSKLPEAVLGPLKTVSNRGLADLT